ncbi:MAG: cobalt ECF transporter T component CbiQ [Chlorobiaceae bacterium]|nr:cobalt ECF transporter T component CbiQ [Chlorobiaceae bacterium]
MEHETRQFRLPVGDGAAIILLTLYTLFVISVPKYDLAGAIVFAAFPLLMATAGKFPLLKLIKRITIVSPFILFMAAGNLFLDRSPALFVAGYTATGGMVSASVIAVKSLITISSLLLLIEYLPFHRFGSAIRSLGVPEVFVTQLLLVYRFSFLLTEEAAMIQKARDLRSFANRGRGLIVTAKLIGSLLIRTTSKAENIYMAMSARGFHTGLAASRDIAFKSRDIVTITVSGVLFLLVRSLF